MPTRVKPFLYQITYTPSHQDNFAEEAKLWSNAFYVPSLGIAKDKADSERGVAAKGFLMNPFIPSTTFYIGKSNSNSRGLSG